MDDADSAADPAEADEDDAGTPDEAASDPCSSDEMSSDESDDAEAEVPASFDSDTTLELPGRDGPLGGPPAADSSSSDGSDSEVPNLPADARGNTGLGFNLKALQVGPVPPDNVDDRGSKEPMPLMDESAPKEPKDMIVTPAKRPACFETSSEPKTAKLKPMVSDDDSLLH